MDKYYDFGLEGILVKSKNEITEVVKLVELMDLIAIDNKAIGFFNILGLSLKSL